MRWLAVRLDLISIALITTTGLMIVLMHGQIPPAYAGLAISYAVQVSILACVRPSCAGVERRDWGKGGVCTLAIVLPLDS
jgi:hypothetical protein